MTAGHATHVGCAGSDACFAAGWGAALMEQRSQDAASSWPCANYQAPTTCLTAPSTETGCCDWCREQLARLRRSLETRRIRDASATEETP